MHALVVLLALSTAGTDGLPPIRWVEAGEVSAVVLNRSDLKPLPGATVTLSKSGDSCARTAFTDPSGTVLFRDLPAGDYTLRIDLRGFATSQIGPFRVEHEKSDFQIPEYLVVLNPVRWVDRIEVDGPNH